MKLQQALRTAHEFIRIPQPQPQPQPQPRTFAAASDTMTSSKPPSPAVAGVRSSTDVAPSPVDPPLGSPSKSTPLTSPSKSPLSTVTPYSPDSRSIVSPSDGKLSATPRGWVAVCTAHLCTHVAVRRTNRVAGGRHPHPTAPSRARIASSEDRNAMDAVEAFRTPRQPPALVTEAMRRTDALKRQSRAVTEAMLSCRGCSEC